MGDLEGGKETEGDLESECGGRGRLRVWGGGGRVD